MNKKTVQIIAIVGLVFAVVFSVFLIMTMINDSLFGGKITTITIAVGAFALVLFIVVYLHKRAERKNEELLRQQEEEERLAAAEASSESLCQGDGGVDIKTKKPAPAAKQPDDADEQAPD